jgi:TRAP-type uncharacterized transport system substrate-binding protein
MSKPVPDHTVVSEWREWWRTMLPFALLIAVGVAAVWPIIQPAPPRRVVIATGPEGSSYNDFAAEYAKYFADNGVKLQTRKTNGSRENYLLLADPKSGVDAALVQGGTALPRDQTQNLSAICDVSFEPLFILYRKEAFGSQPLTHLEQVAGKRVAVGKQEGGTYWLATPMLALHGIGTPEDKQTKILNVSGAASIKMLLANEIDVGFYSVSADTGYIHDALSTPGIDAASLKLIPTYASKFEFVTTATLHEGSIDLRNHIPAHDVEMIAPTTAIVVRSNAHKAVTELLVRAAQKVHSKRDPLAPRGAFPTLDYTELPVSSDARYFFTTRPGFLQRTLPFWLASLIDRLLILLVPLLVVLIPMSRFAPRLYQWRMRARVYRWYKRLRALDARVQTARTPAEQETDRAEADALEAEICRSTRIPLGYMESFYNLRVHLGYLRNRLKEASG